VRCSVNFFALGIMLVQCIYVNKYSFFNFCNGCTHSIWTIPGQGLNSSCSCHPRCSNSNARSFNPLSQARDAVTQRNWQTGYLQLLFTVRRCCECSYTHFLGHTYKSFSEIYFWIRIVMLQSVRTSALPDNSRLLCRMLVPIFVTLELRPVIKKVLANGRYVKLFWKSTLLCWLS